MRVFTRLSLFTSALLLLASSFANAVINPWTATGSLAGARSGHTATLLPTGKLLVAGGTTTGSDSLQSAELFDPATNTWSAAAALATPRLHHTATLLQSGKVLVVGSQGVDSAELYDPATNTWSAAGSLKYARYLHTATLLPSGKVLVAGGFGRDLSGSAPEDYLAAAEIYDPATNSWSLAASLATARYLHTAILLPSGKVLVAGGYGSTSYLGAAEVYDPANNTWSSAGAAVGRTGHTATLLASGKVLVVGGNSGSGTIADPELYDPATNSWSTAGTGPGVLPVARFNHSATLLPSGRLLIAGGRASSYLDDAVLYDPAANSWAPAGHLVVARYLHSATLLPTGEILIVGGDNGSSLASAEMYDPAAAMSSAVGAMQAPRDFFPATLLPSGKVLAAGGGGSSADIAKADLYDPVATTWTAAAPMLIGRFSSTLTLLPSGRVLVAGGFANSGVTTDAELYDPAANSWTTTAALSATARSNHTATLLSSGKVLVSGGLDSGSNAIANADLYDPATSSWTSQGNLAAARDYHTATLLRSGKVLVVGGAGIGGTALASAELYDPATHGWTAAAAPVARYSHTATLLPSGKVLVAGGFGASILSGTQLYDPATDSWSAGGSLAIARGYHTATLLPSGKVLVAGGITYNGSFATVVSTEIYDPATNAWTPGADLASARYTHTATLLASGAVLLMGGIHVANSSTAVNDAEVYDAGLAPDTLRQPNLSAASAFLLQTSALAATASGSSVDGTTGATTATGFTPQIEAGGGASNNSATNLPVLQVQRIDNGQLLFVANDETVSVTDTNFTGSATTFAGFPAGPVLVRAWVNGVPSAARYSTLAVTPGTPEPAATGGVLQAAVAFDPVDNGGAPVTYTATAAPGGATASCAAPCTSIAFNPIAPGTYTFTVVAINAAGAGAPSPASNSAIVTQATTTLTVSTAAGSLTAPGVTVTFTATLAGAVGPSGNITFCADATTTDAACTGGTLLCAVAASTSPVDCDTNALTNGEHMITAFFAGDTNNSAATSAVLFHAVGIRPAFTSANGTTFIVATPGSFTVTTTGTPTPTIGATGTLPPGVTFVDNGNGTGTLSGTPALNSVAAYPLTLGLLNGTGELVEQIFTLTVTKAEQTLTFSAQSPPGHDFVDSGTFPISPLATSAPPNSGNPITYSSLTTDVCLVSATTVTMVSVGTCTIAADQSGDVDNFNPAIQVTQNVAIGLTPSSVVLTSSDNPSNVGQAVTFTATVVPGASTTGTGIHSSAMAAVSPRMHPQGAIQAFPAGTVSFADGATVLGSAPLNNGSTSLTTTFAVPGSHTITATYSGDANTAAASITLVQVVNAAETTSVPALSTWMLVLLGALLGAIAVIRVARTNES